LGQIRENGAKGRPEKTKEVISNRAGELTMKQTTPRRHKSDKKTFEELSFTEQAEFINIKVVWFLSATLPPTPSASMRTATKRRSEELRGSSPEHGSLGTARINSCPDTSQTFLHSAAPTGLVMFPTFPQALPTPANQNRAQE
jgi:hypothetical protein